MKWPKAYEKRSKRENGTVISGERVSHAAGREVARHWHADGQLSIVLSGTMKVRVDAGWWLSPPGRSLWLPPQARHAATYSESTDLILLKIPSSRAQSLAAQPFTMAVSDLLRELAKELLRTGPGADGSEYKQLITELLLHQIPRAEAAPALFLPAGTDARLNRVIAQLRADPAIQVQLDDLARRAGSSRRTIARLFIAETGMTFARWRDHLRIVTALDMLVRGHTITETALTVGYQTQSSFTTMFSRILGAPPRRFLRDGGRPVLPPRSINTLPLIPNDP